MCQVLLLFFTITKWQKALMRLHWSDCVNTQASLAFDVCMQQNTFFLQYNDFQPCGILTSVDLDEPVKPPYELRNSKWCTVSSLTLMEYSSD